MGTSVRHTKSKQGRGNTYRPNPPNPISLRNIPERAYMYTDTINSYLPHTHTSSLGKAYSPLSLSLSAAASFPKTARLKRHAITT